MIIQLLVVFRGVVVVRPNRRRFSQVHGEFIGKAIPPRLYNLGLPNFLPLPIDEGVIVVVIPFLFLETDKAGGELGGLNMKGEMEVGGRRTFRWSSQHSSEEGLQNMH